LNSVMDNTPWVPLGIGLGLLVSGISLFPQFGWCLLLAIGLISIGFVYMMLNEKLNNTFRAKANKDGKDTTIITGATHGIGLSLAKLFVRDGFNVIIIARYKEDLERARDDLQLINPSVKVITMQKDLFKEEAAQEIFDEVYSNKEVKDSNLRINSLVNNAGFCIRGDFLEVSLEQQMQMIRLNVDNYVKMTWLFGNKFRNQINTGSENCFRILNVASFASVIISPFLSTYSGTKAFIHSFSLGINEEWKAGKFRGKLTCTSLCPGYTATPSLPSAGIQHSNVWKMFKNWDLPNRTAAAGYRAMMTGQSYVIVGYLNNIYYWLSSSIMPLSWSAKMSKFVNADFQDTLNIEQTLKEGLVVKRGTESEASTHPPLDPILSK